MTKKPIIVLFLFNTIAVVTSCLDQCDQYKYHDFDQVSITALNPIVNLEDSLTLRIETPNDWFVASKNSQFSLIANANALDCNMGWGGLKFPVTKIEVTSDSDFNDNFPKNSILNEMIFMRNWTTDDDYVWTNISNVDDEEDWRWMYMKERPTLSKFHKLTIKLYKSNGDIVTGTSDIIEWK